MRRGLFLNIYLVFVKSKEEELNKLKVNLMDVCGVRKNGNKNGEKLELQ